MNAPLELRDLLSSIFVWEFLNKTVIPHRYNKMCLSDIRNNFNILIIINLKYLNDTHRERVCFAQFSTRMVVCNLIDIFFLSRFSFATIHESLTPHYHGARFTAKFGLIFVLTLETAFSWRFHYKANGKSIDSSQKLGIGIFKIAFRSRGWHVFMLMKYLV